MRQAQQRRLPALLSRALLLSSLLVALFGCSPDQPAAEEDLRRKLSSGEILRPPVAEAGNPEARYYLLSASPQSVKDDLITIELDQTGKELTALGSLELQQDDIVVLNGEVVFAPQPDFSALSELGALRLTTDASSAPLASRNVNFVKSSVTRRAFVNATFKIRDGAAHRFALTLSRDPSEKPGAATKVTLGLMRLTAQIYRPSLRKNLLAAENREENYFLKNLQQARGHDSKALDHNAHVVLEIPQISLKKGDLILAHTAWSARPESENDSCWGVSLNSWLTLDEARTGITAQTVDIANAPWAQDQLGLDVFEVTADNAAYNIRLKLKSSLEGCPLKINSGSDFLALQVFRKVATSAAELTWGHYLHAIHERHLSNREMLTAPEPSLQNINAVTPELAASDILQTSGYFTLSSDQENKETSIILQLINDSKKLASPLIYAVQPAGVPRVSLAARSFYALVPGQGGFEPLAAKAALKNSYGAPIWLENSDLSLIQFRRFPATYDPEQNSAEALDKVAVLNKVADIAKTPLLKERTGCALLSRATDIKVPGIDEATVPVPLYKFEGVHDRAQDSYTFKLAVGYPIYDVSKPSFVYLPDQKEVPGFLSRYYTVTVTGALQKECKVSAQKS
jgi:hypothetical protein